MFYIVERLDQAGGDEVVGVFSSSIKAQTFIANCNKGGELNGYHVTLHILDEENYDSYVAIED